MKQRNIKKALRRRVKDEGRYYYSVAFKYDQFGFRKDDLNVMELISKTLNLVPIECDRTSYHFYDYNNQKNGIPQFVNFSIDDHLSSCAELVKDEMIDGHEVTMFDGFSFTYNINLMKGWRNPAYDFFDENNEEPYWIDDEHPSREYYDERDDDADFAREILRRHINCQNLNMALWSGNMVCSNFLGLQNPIGDELPPLVDDISMLTNYTKSTYQNMGHDKITVDFGVRCKEYQEPFVRDMAKIIRKYRIKKW